MRIAIISDVHANVVALEAALKAINTQGYDLLFHLGDSIDLGPYPAETVQLLLQIPRATYIMGDHDMFFMNNLEGFTPKVLGEEEHYRWSHAQLTPKLREEIGKWSFIQRHTFEGLRISFAHYGLTSNEKDFLPLIYEPRVADMDQLFATDDTDLFLFGHVHKIINAFGAKHYLNPGSIGVNNYGHIPFILLDIQSGGTYEVRQFQVAYDMAPVIRAFKDRNVPNYEQIVKIFYYKSSSSLPSTDLMSL